ncbi:MAG: tripartite tricarboxylate transporter TctB family protein [Anaerolineaceae bacterium]|nr:MAG: tripartite tricarboxylate transporter TctB family protein [Anaerolineaceae bacterium]
MTSGNDSKPAFSTRALFSLRAVALTVIILGGIILTQVSQIGTGAGFIVVGPRVFPTAIGIGILILGFLFLLRTTVVLDNDLVADVVSENATTDWTTTMLTLLSLVAYASLLHPLGYAIATAFFFPVIGRILGSTQLRRDIIVGVALGLVIYLAFTRVLGVRLPAGLLTGIL